MIPRLKEQYEKVTIENLQKKFSMKNKLMVPRFLKIVLNMGLGSEAADKKKVQNCVEDMSLISGQKPVITKFKKSISNFKTRKGASSGVKVTLRNKKMFEEVIRRVRVLVDLLKEKKTPILEPSIECSTCQYYERCFTQRKESKTINLMNLLGKSKNRSDMIDEI